MKNCKVSRLLLQGITVLMDIYLHGFNEKLRPILVRRILFTCGDLAVFENDFTFF